MSKVGFPSFLFRYRRIGPYFEEELRRAVNGQQVYMPLTSTVNDPFDLAPVPVVSPVPEVLKDLRRSHQGRRTISRQRFIDLHGKSVDRSTWLKTTRELRPSVRLAKEENRVALKTLGELRLKSRLSCFSETNESTPMWAHYAGHDGVCIRYEFVRNPLAFLPFYPIPVRYSSHRPIISTMQLRAFTERSSLTRRMSREEREKIFDAIFLTKDISWSYEREWRIVDIEKCPPRYEKIDALNVTALYFGVNAAEQLMMRIVDEFGGRIAIFKAKVHPQRYGFDFDRVD